MNRSKFFLTAALVIALGFGFSSCKKDNDKEPEKNNTEQSQTISGGTSTEKPSEETKTDETKTDETKPETFTVDFNLLDGSGTATPQTVEKGVKITLPSGDDIKKEGYVFKGWSLTENGEIITEYTVTGENVTFFAVWNPLFKVDFNILDGSGTATPQTVEKGQKITLPSGENLTKEGYVFKGWSLTGNGEIITEYTVTGENVTLFAVWNPLFTVEFNTDGGTGDIKTQIVEKGEKATIPTTVPEKDGLIFKGWYLGENKYDFETAVQGKLELKAKYYRFEFTVNADGKKVVFSPGNLQYDKSEGKFLFANSQTVYLGTNQGNVIDLFGWGMWLDEFAKDESKITNTEEDDSKYAPALNNNEFANNKTTVNGTVWFTLSQKEWNYLLIRKDADKNEKYGVATVDGVNGLIILPDEWIDPIGVKKFTSGMASSNGAGYYKTKNEYTDKDWEKLENNGAVFLPACGMRYGSSFDYVGEEGRYWLSSSKTKDPQAYYFRSYFYNCSSVLHCYFGYAVRLVRVLQN